MSNDDAREKSFTLCVTISAPPDATASSNTWSSFGSDSWGRQRKWILRVSARRHNPFSISSTSRFVRNSKSCFCRSTSSYSNSSVVETNGTIRPCSIHCRMRCDAPVAEYSPAYKTLVSITARYCPFGFMLEMMPRPVSYGKAHLEFTRYISKLRHRTKKVHLFTGFLFPVVRIPCYISRCKPRMMRLDTLE